MTKHADKTNTYINRANGATLDTETGHAPPKRGDGVTFLEVGGRWRVVNVTRQRDGKRDVRVERE